MPVYCLECSKVVRGGHHAVSCDLCEGWQHLKCNTGISRESYVAATKGREELKFICHSCSQQVDEIAEEATEESFMLEPPPLSPQLPTLERVEAVDVLEVPPVLESSVHYDDSSDFQSETTTPTGLRGAFDDPEIRGCAFHWNQAVWRQVQQLGLQVAYSEKDEVYKFVRKLFALPFLSAEHILPTFQKLREKATGDQIEALMDYVDETWLNNSVWAVQSWCMFGQTTRTNNDCEGWHHRINKRAKKDNLQFYLLVVLLYKEASILPTQVKMVSEGKLRRFQRKSTRQLQGRLFSLWTAYDEGQVSVNGLLKRVGKIYGCQ